eukprot:m.74572 g.74572  ORF g.74572 m.74572 type:complete len:126 (-) comp11810_c0_seq1:128-505(-)
MALLVCGCVVLVSMHKKISIGRMSLKVVSSHHWIQLRHMGECVSPSTTNTLPVHAFNRTLSVSSLTVNENDLENAFPCILMESGDLVFITPATYTNFRITVLETFESSGATSNGLCEFRGFLLGP